MQTASSKIQTRFALSISVGDNHYTTSASITHTYTHKGALKVLKHFSNECFCCGCKSDETHLCEVFKSHIELNKTQSIRAPSNS